MESNNLELNASLMAEPDAASATQSGFNGGVSA